MAFLTSSKAETRTQAKAVLEKAVSAAPTISAAPHSRVTSKLRVMLEFT